MKTFKKFMSEATSPEQEFYNRIYRQAAAAGERFPHLVAAQASLESDYGRSPSGKNNYFGQTASTGSNLATQEYGGGGYYNTRQTFADYDDEEQGTRTRVKMWAPQYGNAKDELEAARNLQLPAGSKIPGSNEVSLGAYASSPEYVSSLERIMGERRGGVGNDSPSGASQSSYKPSKGSLNTPQKTKVLAKLKDKTGELDKTTGKFTERGWDKPESTRFDKYKKLQSATTPPKPKK